MLSPKFFRSRPEGLFQFPQFGARGGLSKRSALQKSKKPVPKPGFLVVAAILKSFCRAQTCRLRDVQNAACSSRDLPKPRGNMRSTASSLLPYAKCQPVFSPTLPRKDFFDYTRNRRCISQDKVLPSSGALSYFVLSLWLMYVALLSVHANQPTNKKKGEPSADECNYSQ